VDEEYPVRFFAGRHARWFPLSGVTAYPGSIIVGTGSFQGPYVHGIAYILLPPTSARPTWKYGVIHNFGAPGDGATPQAPLVVGPHGIIYGTTQFGGTFGLGAVFALQHH
jgi:hypothetical protein